MISYVGLDTSYAATLKPTVIKEPTSTSSHRRPSTAKKSPMDMCGSPPCITRSPVLLDRGPY